ncbi:FAD-binding protein, partial [Actinomadura sp. LOL_011]|uniref:FAD-binding protein n=1 Tax=Actinomadura sp. LOL_011 TaxID=3345410 RepID=UPI003A80721C
HPDLVLGLVLAATRAMPDADLTPHGPPPVADLGISRPRVRAPRTPEHLASDAPPDRAAHSHGQAFRDVVRCLLGRLDHVVDLVVRPRTEQDVVDVLDWATATGTAVIPFGGGTSVVGGVEPRNLDGYPGTVSLDLTGLDRVLQVGPVSRAARVQRQDRPRPRRHPQPRRPHPPTHPLTPGPCRRPGAGDDGGDPAARPSAVRAP